MIQVDFQHEIGDQIWIKALNLKGVVMACCYRGLASDYRIIFWSESKRFDEWLFDFEIEAVREGK